MTFGAESGIVRLATRVILTAHAGPVIGRIPQTRVAPSPHDHHLSLATPPSDRRRAGITAERVVISFSERLRRLREHRGADHPTHSRQGKKDFHVTMLDHLLGCEVPALRHQANASPERA